MGATDSPEADFDAYAAKYDAALAQGLDLSGEGKEYFAERRITWLASRLAAFEALRAPAVLDFGCGTGTATPYLREALGAGEVVGVDPSAASLDMARRRHGHPSVRFATLAEHRPAASFDVAFCNGVFHHIPRDRRGSAVDVVLDSLRPGGWFAFWENNPWNPGARLVMRRIAFDRDAVMVSARECRQLLRERGFIVLRTDFLFIFPRALRFARPLERWVSRLPFGAQYMVLARKPVDPVAARSRGGRPAVTSTSQAL